MLGQKTECGWIFGARCLYAQFLCTASGTESIGVGTNVVISQTHWLVSQERLSPRAGTSIFIVYTVVPSGGSGSKFTAGVSHHICLPTHPPEHLILVAPQAPALDKTVFKAVRSCQTNEDQTFESVERASSQTIIWSCLICVRIKIVDAIRFPLLALSGPVLSCCFFVLQNLNSYLAVSDPNFKI